MGRGGRLVEASSVNEMWRISFPYWHFIVRAVVVYVFVIILLRLGGKREIGQMGSGEFVAILLISNAVQNSMNGGDNSITGGMILSIVIIALSVLVAYLTYRSKRWERLIQGRPTILIRNGIFIEHNLRRELLSTYELRTILRRQGIHDISDVVVAILESNGSVSVTRQSDLKHDHDTDEEAGDP